VLRFHPDGKPDPTFGTNGVFDYGQPSGFYKILVDPDGSIVAAGHVGAAGAERGLLVRIH
jgi:hypothetical protein